MYLLTTKLIAFSQDVLMWRNPHSQHCHTHSASSHSYSTTHTHTPPILNCPVYHSYSPFPTHTHIQLSHSHSVIHTHCWIHKRMAPKGEVRHMTQGNMSCITHPSFLITPAIECSSPCALAYIQEVRPGC